MQAERRLAAIFSADAVGYSRLMAEDDVLTLRLMKEHRETMAGLVRQHAGRVVDAVGDNLLAEFASAVDAVNCAIQVQEKFAAINAQQPETATLNFRIGINVGELVVDEDRIAGDGVNIAARVEALAPVGGIAITGTVLDHVEGRLNIKPVDQGLIELKNVPRKVRVLLITPEAKAAAVASSPQGPATVPGFAGRHTIAVLPFRNLSQDVEQEYFAEGLAEDLINRLSALRLYPVIARNSTFAYKNDNRDVREIGSLLGAHYIVSGSVRRSGDKVRIGVELVDADDARQLWSNRYDRELSDIFELQDEMTDAIAGSLGPVLSHSETRHAMKRTPKDIDAWDCLHRGIWHLTRTNRSDIMEAKKWANRALDLRPNSAGAYTLLAFCHQSELIYRWSDASHDETIRLAFEAAEKAVDLDPDDHMALTALGYACNLFGDQDRAISILERAIDLNPSSSLGHWALGAALSVAGRPDEGIPLIQKAISLSPRDPVMHEFLFNIGVGHFIAGRYEQAIEFGQKSLNERAGQAGAYRLIGASCGYLGRNEQGREAVDQMMELVPGMSEEHLQSFLPHHVAALYADGLRKVGWAG